MKWFFLLLVVSVGVASSIQSARAGDVAAYLVDYSDASGGIEIRRGTISVPIGIGTPLEAGDIIRVTGSASATIDSGRGTSTIVVAAASPFTVEDRGSLTAFQGELTQLMQIIHWQAHEGPIAARTRDSADLIVPILDTEALKQKLVAGPRAILLEWFDGVPPFRWKVVAQGTIDFEQVATAKRKIVIATTFAPGPAVLSVSDGAGVTHSFALEVVNSLPAALAKLVSEAHSPIQRISAAAALTRTEKGAFNLEAVSLLSKPGATQAEAEFSEALEMGERP